MRSLLELIPLTIWLALAMAGLPFIGRLLA